MTQLAQRDRRFPVPRPNEEPRVYNKNLAKGSALVTGMNLASLTAHMGTTVSSATWSSDNTSVAALSGDATTAITTYVTVTAGSQGNALLTNTVTMANGEITVHHIRVRVYDPNSETLTDYLDKYE